MTEVAAEISANLIFKPSSFPPVMDCVSVILIICRLSLYNENTSMQRNYGTHPRGES